MKKNKQKSATIESPLKDILFRFEQQLDNLQKDINDLKIELTTVKIKVEGLDANVKEIKDSQKSQVWSLIWILTWTLVGLLTTVTVGMSIYFTVVIFTSKP